MPIYQKSVNKETLPQKKFRIFFLETHQKHNDILALYFLKKL